MAKDSTQPKAGTWTEAKAQRAASEHKYVRVGAYVGAGGDIKLSGAEKFWEGTKTRAALPALVYVPEARAVGSAGDLMAALPGYAQAINAGYTQANVQVGGMNHQRYTNELAAAKSWADSSKTVAGPKKATKDDAALLSTLAGQAAASEAAADAALKAAKEASKETGAAKSTRAGKARKSLLEKLMALEAGKVLDVSGMQADGTGVNTIKTPTAKSKKYGAPGLNIVSNNEATFKSAVASLGQGYSQFAGRWRAQAPAVRAASPTPAVSGRTSPPRSFAVPRAVSPGRR